MSKNKSIHEKFPWIKIVAAQKKADKQAAEIQDAITTGNPGTAAFVAKKYNLRLPELERIIVRNPRLIAHYALELVGGRWPEGEKHLLKPGPEFLDHIQCKLIIDYAVRVIKGRWPEAEDTIIKDGTYLGEYGRKIIKSRWVEAEQRLLQIAGYGHILAYIKKEIRDSWPEAEPILKKNPRVWRKYLKILRKQKQKLP